MNLLEVSGLSVGLPTADGLVRAVDGLSFSVAAGELFGVVGESGSGKSVTMSTLVGLLPGAQASGSALFEGEDLLTLPPARMRALRGRRIGMIFQDPLSSLHPHFTVGWQIAEMVRAHEDVTRRQAMARAVDMLGRVGVPDPARRAAEHPHQFSGGMRQRAMIAMALALNPALIIADEPTTALDTTVQAQILELFGSIQQEYGTSIIMITHDLEVLADIADRVMVMYAGRRMEAGTREEIFTRPRHPYTRGLLDSSPARHPGAGRLRPIDGRPPSLVSPPAGCVFHPRCPVSTDACATDRPPVRTGPAGSTAWTCWLDALPAPPAAPPAAARTPAAKAGGRTLIRAKGIVKNFDGPRGPFRRGTAPIRALDGVDLELREGETFGLVGESGCGKSTLARCLAGLHPLTGGHLTINGTDVSSGDPRAWNTVRRDVQMVFQDPYGSLNPRRRIGSVIAEPFRIHQALEGSELRRRVQELMETVGLDPEHYNRFPAEFSGGQRQRIGIARALALRPRIIICDEPVSALDVSVQAQILNLLSDLQDAFGLTYVFIAHDLSVVRHISDRVGVMYLGRLVEVGDSEQIATRPAHPYTRALLSAMPSGGDPARSARRIALRGDPPSPSAPPPGCVFHPRCAHADAECSASRPALLPGPDTSGHLAACFHRLHHGDTPATAR
ncbi:ABC transporter ATP-binding protein [Streptomyces sp. NPDC052077]|uniref:ABC transporter ATP-binding protein n=1 Tax=Streptomyces sp. NPDC052077 TaxID=3154757 RepID=UPI00344A2175